MGELELLKDCYQSRLEFAFASKTSIKEVMEMSMEDFLIVLNCWNDYVDKKNKEGGNDA